MISMIYWVWFPKKKWERNNKNNKPNNK